MLNEAAKKQNCMLVNPYGESMNNSSDDGDFEVTLVPFYDFTSMLHESHHALDDGDCTHFCYTPHIYYPVWRHLRIALDRLTSQDL